MKRSCPIFVHGVYGSVGVNKELGAFWLTVGGGTVQWCPQVVVARPDVGACADQTRHDAAVTMYASQMKGSIALRVVIVDRKLVHVQNVTAYPKLIK